jgi:WD40 repeat protein
MSEFKKQLGKMSRQEQEQLLVLETLPGRLAKSKQGEKLYQLLTDFDFIEAKLELLGVQPLIEDYDLARTYDVLLSKEQTEILKLIQGAIRKSASILDEDKTQLAEQLLGRLLDFEEPDIQRLLEQGRQSKNSIWLRPLRGNLERPGEGCLRTLIGHTRDVTAVTIAPDGLTAISASDDRTLKIWDIKTGTELLTLTGHTSSVSAVAIAPDGKTAISASGDKTLKIWDTETGTEVRTLTGHINPVTAVAIAPDGKTAISASQDNTLKIWDIDSGTELLTLTGHTESIYGVAIAPDGKTALSASDDNTLKIWDLLTGKEIASFSGDVSFNGCSISPDGVTVVAGDVSGRVHFLRLEGMGDLGNAAGLNNPVSLFYSGLALAKQGQYEPALAKLTEVAEMRPDALIVCLERCQVLYELERYAEAVASLDKAIEIAGKDRDFWFCRGFALVKCGSQEAARESLDFAINIQPDDCDFWFEKSKALFELERYEQAIGGLYLAIKIEPNESYLWDWLGIAMRRLGRAEEAISIYERALELQPDDPDILDHRAYALLTLGRYDEAMADWDKVLEIDPNHANAYCNKACYFALQDQVELVLENLRRAIELEPEEYRELAKTDADFDGIRGDVRFQELLLG